MCSRALLVALFITSVACAPEIAPPPSQRVTVRTANASPAISGAPAAIPGLGPLEVVPDVAGADGCGDAFLVTLEAIARGEHQGARVALVGVPTPRTAFTVKFCGLPLDACCNECTGGWVLGLGKTDVIELAGIGDCSGYDCNFHCDPFGRTPTHRYRFVGRIEHTRFAAPFRLGLAGSHMVVEKFCRADEDNARL